MPNFELVFREVVAYRFIVSAPDRKTAEAWATRNTKRLCNEHVESQIVEERGWEELKEVGKDVKIDYHLKRKNTKT